MRHNKNDNEITKLYFDNIVRHYDILNNDLDNEKQKLICDFLDVKNFEDATSMLEKAGFLNVAYIETAYDYIVLINTLLDKHYPKRINCGNKKEKVPFRVKYIFRGISNFKETKSHVNRENNNSDDLIGEAERIRKFEENASFKLGRFNNPIDLAAAARHYGIHNRLVDWSFSPLVATLFALNSDMAGNKCLRGLLSANYRQVCNVHNLPMGLHNHLEDEPFANYNDLPLFKKYYETMKYYERIEESKNRIKKYGLLGAFQRMNEANGEAVARDFVTKKEKDWDIFKKDYDLIINYFNQIVFMTSIEKNEETVTKLAIKYLESHQGLFIEPNYSNERLIFQRGLFEIDNGQHDDPGFYKGMVLFLISPNARLEIIKYINNLGINYYMLQGDPDNASKVVGETYSGAYDFDTKISYFNKYHK